MNSRDWADMASVYRAGAQKASAYRTETGQATAQDLILTAMADQCARLASVRAAEEQAAAR